MSDEKYVGPIAAAKNAALVKANLNKKLDKTGGTVTGSLEINGDMHAGGAVQSDLLLSAPSVAVHNDAEEASVYINCSGDNAARITSLGSDGKSHYSRFAVGTPTGDNDAATKAYVDSKSAAAGTTRTTFDVWLTSTEPEYSDGMYVFACASDANYTELFNLAKNGAFIEGALYSGSDKDDRLSTLIFGSVSGEAGFGSLNFTCANPIDLQLENGLLGSVMHITFTDLGGTAPTILLTGGAGYVPSPNPDNSDDGKSLVVNGHKWEMKKADGVTDVATESTNGLMSAADKAKLNGIAAGATRTTVDGLLLDNSDNPVSNRVLKAALDAKAYKTVATGEADGLMSASDKSKLDGIESGANKTIVDSALDASSTNSVQNKAVKAALDNKADKTALDTKADTTVATASANGLMSAADKKKLDSMYDVVATSTDGETFDITPAQLHEKLKGVPTACAIKVVDTIIPLHRVQLPGDGNTKYIFQIIKDDGWKPNTRLSYTATAGGTSSGAWVKSEYELLASTPGILKFTGAAEALFRGTKDVTIDIPTGEGAVRYDETQELTSDQKSKACVNIGAVRQKGAWMEGTVMLLPSGADGSRIINITPSDKSNDYTLTLDAGPENVPAYVAGIETPTDAQADYAANVAYVKAKIAEVAASGGVDVDNALSATSTNPVQNKVVTAALTGKAGTAVATQSINGLMSAADKKKLDGIAAGANKITIDSAMSGSSVNPVQNKVIKQYVDDKVAAAGSNITVDTSLSSTSTNPVQNKAVKAAIDAKADKTALDAKMDKSGGTFTGNVYGKYFCGTWLQSTAASDLGRTPGKIAVLDDSGWMYYRTPSELFADLGITNAIKSYVDTAIVAAINSGY